MLPGIQSRLSESVVASASSIQVLSDIAYVTGSTSIATITAPSQGGFSSLIVIVPTDGAVATLTTGNISLAVTMPQNRATVLVYSFKNSLWYPGAIS